jgi:hypothetical protein
MPRATLRAGKGRISINLFMRWAASEAASLSAFLRRRASVVALLNVTGAC